jgi:hypothetical protein
VTRASQAITFPPLPDRPFFPPSPFVVSAAVSSGLPVIFRAGGACSISGEVVIPISPGPCTITADQPGNNNYSPAPSVSVTFFFV